MNAPYCFVLMPFGQKVDATGMMIDFDRVYRDVIAPAIQEATLEPLRADEEMSGGIIHKPMFERLILCEYAVADLTTANANVFYELGIRHAVRPWSTVLLFARNSRLPFDVAPLRAMPYQLSSEGTPADVDKTRDELTKRLREAQDTLIKSGSATDSPLFQLVEGFPQVDYTKADVFRERMENSKTLKDNLAAARRKGVEDIRQIEHELRPLAHQESGIVIDLFLSYRAVQAWDEMIALVDKMSPALGATVMVQEQFALALNRTGQGERAETVITEVLNRRGPSSETYGILGRVYKDRWEAASKRGDTVLARGLLEKAIEAYLNGFEADWRDASSGVNAVTLMEIKEPPDLRSGRIIPVVAYSAERRIASTKPHYWDYATLLELAVLAKDPQGASDALSRSLAAQPEPWQRETTARNLRLIREARERRGDFVPWTKKSEEALDRRPAPST
jgi:hypothetical protein